MTDIFIIGDENDTAAEKLITEYLSATYEITYIKRGSICRSGSGYGLLCADFPKPYIKGVKSPVILAKSSAVINVPLPSDSIAIINADFAPQVAAIGRSGINAVTCGLSASSTISFSSESDETLVVSLNRSLTALSGRVIQPLEIPMRKISDSYTIMSFTALRLLLDDFESELGKLM